MRRLSISLALSLVASGLVAVEPETCLVPAGSSAAVSVEYGGRTWELASTECRELFLSDPERYSQLFDALAEMGVSAAPEPEEDVALVPN